MAGNSCFDGKLEAVNRCYNSKVEVAKRHFVAKYVEELTVAMMIKYVEALNSCCGSRGIKLRLQN